jgi:hypothetical protein
VLNKLYLALGGLIPLAFAVMAFTGTELGGQERIDPHHKGGGVRSIFFWSSGYHGGK